MIKRPVFVALLALVLGEIIAVMKLSTWGISVVFILCVLIKIITKKQATVFVMIFLFVAGGYFVTENEIQSRDNLYRQPTQEIVLTGTVKKIQEGKSAWSLYLEQVCWMRETESARQNSDGPKREQEAVKCRRILVTMYQRPTAKIGNKVQVQGELQQFATAGNDGNFDSRFYYMTQGIYARVQGEKLRVVDQQMNLIRQSLSQYRARIRQYLIQLCEKEYQGIWRVLQNKSAVFSAILLGEKSELDEEIRELYSVSGIAHVLAISGLHISFLGMAVFSLLRRRFKFVISGSLAMVIVLAFGIMSGEGIAAMRAIVMFGLKLVGEILGRKYDSLTAMSMAGGCLMIQNPFVIFHSGFQMSFAAIVAIVLLWPVMCETLQVQNKLMASVLLSFNISVVMNPIIAFNYFQLPTYAMALNLLVVPMMSVVMVSGVSTILVWGFIPGTIISQTIGKFLILPGSAILTVYEKLCREYKTSGGKYDCGKTRKRSDGDILYNFGNRIDVGKTHWKKTSEETTKSTYRKKRNLNQGRKDDIAERKIYYLQEPTGVGRSLPDSLGHSLSSDFSATV